MRRTQVSADLSVSALGVGCSSMTYSADATGNDSDESVRVIKRALDLGINFFDTADVYGPHTSEELLGKALGPQRDKVVVATKCGLVSEPDGRLTRNARPDHLRRACEASLRRLRVDSIALYQLHRIDPAVPLAETWGALGELVTEGKVRALGISHATVAELDLAHKIFAISAVQCELSVWATKNRDEILPWCQKNNAVCVAFSVIGRGFLSGTVDPAALAEDDSRRRDPRFTADAARSNAAIVAGLRKIAARHGATPAQVAIAWALAQGENVVPVPGTRRVRWLEENVAALVLRLTGADFREIDRLPQAVGEKDWDFARTADCQEPSRG